MDKEQSKAKLKDLMPKVAQIVSERRKQWGDAHVTDAVTRGMAGERNCFYAFENGRIVGTAFDCHADLEHLAKFGALFEGSAFVAMREPDHGAN